MPLCPTCGTSLDANARFCPKDGTTIRADSVLVPIIDAGDAGLKPTVPVKRARKSTATDKPTEDPLIGRVLDGRYRIRSRLGQGGVGAVYEGEHLQIKKTVAIKVLHAIYGSTEEFRKRFEREARAASRLSHPACVQVLDFGRVEKIEPDDAPSLVGMPYLVMEFVRGTVLLDRLIDGPAIPPPEAVGYAVDLLAALKHAHGFGIVHRDIKPANVMLMSGDATGISIKLLDFGLAKEMGAEGGKEALTQAGMVFGTPGYLSPEQAAGRSVDERADLYSLGVLLFEMVCNRRLFEREDPLDAVRDHLHSRPPDPRSINPAVSAPLAQAILKALEKDPARRHANAQQFADALKACPESGKGPQVAAGRRWWRTPPSLGPVPGWAWSAGVGLLLVGGVLAAGVVRSQKPAPAPSIVQPPGAAAIQPRLSDGARYAFDLLHADRVDEAVNAARSALKDNPHDGAAHRALGTAYARKLWCSDSIDELDRALRDDPQLRSEPDLARRAIACLGPKTQAKAAHFLVEKLGNEARRPLQEAAAGEPSIELRHAAQKTLERLPP